MVIENKIIKFSWMILKLQTCSSVTFFT